MAMAGSLAAKGAVVTDWSVWADAWSASGESSAPDVRVVRHDERVADLEGSAPDIIINHYRVGEGGRAAPARDEPEGGARD